MKECCYFPVVQISESFKVALFHIGTNNLIYKKNSTLKYNERIKFNKEFLAFTVSGYLNVLNSFYSEAMLKKRG